MKKSYSIIITLILLNLMLAMTSIPASGEESVKITILHTNDVHGHMMSYEDKKIVPPPEKAGGFQDLATLINNEREKNPGAILLLDSGDIAQGVIYSNLGDGIPMIELLNFLRYDAIVAGNHDFDWGEEKFLNMVKTAEFPYLCPNIVRNIDGNFLEGTQPYTIKEVNGVRIGIIGVACNDTSVFGPLCHLENYYFVSPEETLNTYIPILKYIHKVDLIIALTHLGISNDKELAVKVPDIDIIIGGHSHTPLEEPLLIGDTIVSQAGSYGAYLGKLEIDFNKDEKTITSYKGELISLIDSEIEDDPQVSWLLEQYKNKYDVIAHKIVGAAAIDLTIDKGNESNLGNLFADLMKHYGKSDLAIINSGGIRANIPAGDVTMAKVYEVFPFDNLLVTLDLKGKYLKEILESSFSGDHAVLQVSGVIMKCDLSKPEGEKIIDLSINGEPFDPERIYKVATADFLALGGANCEAFKNGENYKNIMLIRDGLADYFSANSPVSSEIEGRIEIIE